MSRTRTPHAEPRERPALAAIDGRGRSQLTELEDDELMLLAAGGREQPFETLVRRHQPLVLGYATRYLGDRQLAAEATQETFLSLWQERERYKRSGRFRAYLVGMAHNRCRALARRRRSAETKAAQLASEPKQSAGSALETLLEAERVARLRRALERLDGRTRAAVLMRYFADLSYDEISHATKQRVGTIKSQVCRGLRKLDGIVAEETT